MRAAALVALAGLGGCAAAVPTEDWRAGRSADGPCYDANLLDGLDTTSTAEAHAVFACLNSTGALDPYAPLDVALDGATRDGPAGLVLARWIADLPLSGGSLGAIVAGALDLLAEPGGVLDAAELGLELAYGAPWPWLGVSVPLDAPASLEAGLLAPALPVLGDVAGAVLDADLAPLTPVAEALRSDAGRRALWTLASVGTSDDATLAALDARWAPDLSDALTRLADGDNDRWTGASGHSLRDLAAAVFADTSDGRIALDRAAGAAAPLLQDARLRDALGVVLAEQVAAGRVAALPAQVRYLASVDRDGGALSVGEDSALVALLRLVDAANRPADCSIDLLLLDVEFSFGNLSVELLRRLARQDPSTVDGGVALLGDLLGVPLTEAALEAVADSGVCPVMDAQLVSDLGAVDRLADPETDELLYVLLDALAAVDDQGGVPDLVDTLSAVHAQGLVSPIEEVVRDVGDTALAGDLVITLGVLLDPWAHHDPAAFPAGLPPLDFASTWDIAAAVLAPDADGRTPASLLTAPARAAIARDETWRALDRFAALAALDDARTAGLLELVARACAADPTLGVLDEAADALDDRSRARAPLVLAESDAVQAAIRTTDAAEAGPVPFTAKLVRGGTLRLILDTLRLLTTLLPEEEE